MTAPNGGRGDAGDLREGRGQPTQATWRTRIAAIMNRNTQGVSVDLLLRILARLGYRAKISFLEAA
jgi:hypothetical protein